MKEEDGIKYGPDGRPRYFSAPADMRPDPWMESQRFIERLEAERASRLAAQEQERAEQTFCAEKAAALSLMDTDRAVEGYQRFITAVCERFNIRMEIGVNMNYRGAAWSRARKIHIRPIVDAETFAVALHEIGHILAGECSRREPHRPTIEDGCYLCIACETDAWERALQLAKFSRSMHQMLTSSLMTCKRRITASPGAVAVLDGMSSRLGFLRHKQNHIVQEMRLERQRIVDEQLARERARYLGRQR